MAKPRVKVDRRKVLQLMQKIGPPLLAEKAAAVVRRIEAAGYPAGYELVRDRNGRPVVMIALTDAKGLNAQIKHGVVTRAAAQEGLDINRYMIR